MPTIDQLAPATAASDTDELPVSQSGIARKVTRAQVLAGLQPQLAIPTDTLMGRCSAGTGAPETIAVGANLVLANGTLSANAASYLVSQLPAGTVPGPGDSVPLGQSGANTAVTYGQFMSGLPGVANVDASHVLVTPTGASGAVKLADYAASTVSSSGGKMVGSLTLAADPAAPLQAATKNYVDTLIATAVPKAGGTLTGPLTLAADPTLALQAATKEYADARLLRSGDTLTGPLMLAGDPTSALQAATKEYADARLLRSGDTLTGPLVLSADPASALQAATKNYVDTQVGTALPKSGGTLTGILTLASDPASAGQAATKNYVDAQVATAMPLNGGTLAGALTLAGDPAATNQAATKHYVDTQVATAVPLSGGILTGALTLAGDPVAANQAATKHYVDAQATIAALPLSGGTLTGALTLAGDPSAASQAATKHYVDTQVATTVPLSGGTLTGALALAADPSTASQAATKHYVDTQVATTVPLSGGTLTGALALAADPSTASQAATKHYVDTQVATAVPLTGGTLTGALALAADPTAASQAATKHYVDGQVATSLPLGGGTLTGTLTLQANPVSALQAATKQYVDAAATGNPTGAITVTSAAYGAKLDGKTDDTAAFIAAYQAAPAGSVIIVPSGVTVVQNPGNWGIALTKLVFWSVNGTTLSNGTPLATAIPGGSPAAYYLPGITIGNSGASNEASRCGSQPTDFAVSHQAYIVNHAGGTAGYVSSNNRTDTILYGTPGNYIWGGLDRLLWCGAQAPSATTPAQHVGRYIQTIRQNATTDANGNPLPQPQLWAACIEYRDTTGKPSSATNAAITCEMDWYGNGADDANTRAVQSLVVGQASLTGSPVQISAVVGVYLSSGSSGYAYDVFKVAIPFSSAVLDTTNAQQMTGAAAIKLAAGHAIAFEPTNSYRLSFDSTSNSLRYNGASQTCVVGKGIAVGWETVCSGATQLTSSLAGNIVFLVGNGSAYTITLPAASTMAAGTGFTFTAIGSSTVTIAPAGTDTIDNAPLVLHQNDRYHVIADGNSAWREVFRTNLVNPHFAGPPVLPSYTVATLPTAQGAGAKAFASNGRKPTEAAAAGTGVEVFYDGAHWISVCSGSAVLA